MGKQDNNKAIKTMIDSVQLMIDNTVANAPFDKTMTGRVSPRISHKKNHRFIIINSKEYELPQFGTGKVADNDIVKVTIRQNNMSNAYFETPTASSEGGGLVTIPQATDTELGGIRASSKDSSYTTEVKIDVNSGKLYVPTTIPITVDDMMSLTSTNPVQNKVITAEFSKYVSKSGDSTIDGNLTVIGEIQGNHINSGTIESSDHVPNSNNQYDLGKQNNLWANIWGKAVHGNSLFEGTTNLRNIYKALDRGNILNPTSASRLNLNSLTTAGTYSVGESGQVAYVDNAPSEASGQAFKIDVDAPTTGFIKQYFYPLNSTNCYLRWSINGGTSWTGWYLSQASMNNYVRIDGSTAMSGNLSTMDLLPSEDGLNSVGIATRRYGSAYINNIYSASVTLSGTSTANIFNPFSGTTSSLGTSSSRWPNIFATVIDATTLKGALFYTYLTDASASNNKVIISDGTGKFTLRDLSSITDPYVLKGGDTMDGDLITMIIKPAEGGLSSVGTLTNYYGSGYFGTVYEGGQSLASKYATINSLGAYVKRDGSVSMTGTFQTVDVVPTGTTNKVGTSTKPYQYGYFQNLQTSTLYGGTDNTITLDSLSTFIADNIHPTEGGLGSLGTLTDYYGSGYFGTVYEGGNTLASKYATINSLNDYLLKAGGTMTGALISLNITPSTATNDIGASSNPYRAGYFGTLYEGGVALSSKYLTSSSLNGYIKADGTVPMIDTLRTMNIIPQDNSGLNEIGTPTYYYGKGYFGTLYENNVALSSKYATIASLNNCLLKSGGTMTGVLTSVNIEPATASNDIGATTKPYRAGYFTNLYEGGQLLSNKYLTSASLSGYVKADGSVSMTGEFKTLDITPTTTSNKVGSATKPYQYGYFNNINSLNITASSLTGTGTNSIITLDPLSTFVANSIKPAESGLGATVGTAADRYSAGYFDNLYEGTTLLSNKYATISSLGDYLPLRGGTLTGTVTSRSIIPGNTTSDVGASANPYRAGYFGTLYEGGVALSSKYLSSASLNGYVKSDGTVPMIDTLKTMSILPQDDSGLNEIGNSTYYYGKGYFGTLYENNVALSSKYASTNDSRLSDLRKPVTTPVNGLDMNDVVETGFYIGYNMTNAAVTTISGFEVIKYSNDWIVQIQHVISGSQGATYRRFRYSGTTWGAWTKITEGSELASYLPLAGGTLTGTLNVQNVLPRTDGVGSIGTLSRAYADATFTDALYFQYGGNRYNVIQNHANSNISINAAGTSGALYLGLYNTGVIVSNKSIQPATGANLGFSYARWSSGYIDSIFATSITLDNINAHDTNQTTTLRRLRSDYDDRATATLPSHYRINNRGYLQLSGLKQATTIGLNTTKYGNYSALVGISPWMDYSGGPVHELSFTQTGKLAHRWGGQTNGVDTWGSWYNFVEEDETGNVNLGGTLALDGSSNGDTYTNATLRVISKMNVPSYIRMGSQTTNRWTITTNSNTASTDFFSLRNEYLANDVVKIMSTDSIIRTRTIYPIGGGINLGGASNKFASVYASAATIDEIYYNGATIKSRYTRYTTTAPSSALSGEMGIYVGSTNPSTKYAGWLYFIT